MWSKVLWSEVMWLRYVIVQLRSEVMWWLSEFVLLWYVIVWLLSLDMASSCVIAVISCKVVLCNSVSGQNGSCLRKFEKHVAIQLQKQLYRKFRMEYFDSRQQL